MHGGVIQEARTQTMNILMTDGTSLAVLGHRDVEGRDNAQTLSQVDTLEEQACSLALEAELQTSEPRMREALAVAFKAAASDATILLRGESVAGKEVLARAIHARSPRATCPLVTLHCQGLSAEILESELFGHVQGGVAGAVRDAVGKVAVAEGGILFLSEIIERGVILAAGPVVALADLPSPIGNLNHVGPGTAAKPWAAGEPPTIEQVEAEHIRRILASTASIGEAATKLGINPSTLYRKRKKYEI
jgi:DNA-binding NtrC family response regulator